jgi:molecular chaperone DnaK
MGRRVDEVGDEQRMIPYQIVGGPSDTVKVDINGKQYSAPEI